MLLGMVVSFALATGTSWALVATLRWVMMVVFDWSPFAASGVEILIGAVLVYMIALEMSRVADRR